MYPLTMNQPRAVAADANVQVDLPAFVHAVDNKRLEFVRKFPAGKIMAFEGTDGFLLTETTAIAKYRA
jgi:elongation factor 1-gamma